MYSMIACVILNFVKVGKEYPNDHQFRIMGGNDAEPVTVLPRETDYRYIGFQFGIGFCAAAAIAILAFAFCVIISSPILFPFLNGFFRGLGW